MNLFLKIRKIFPMLDNKLLYTDEIYNFYSKEILLIYNNIRSNYLLHIFLKFYLLLDFLL